MLALPGPPCIAVLPGEVLPLPLSNPGRDELREMLEKLGCLSPASWCARQALKTGLCCAQEAL